MKIVDLFCGCGGLSLGFEQAGYDILAGFEWWDAAIKVYESNFNHPAIKQDISDIDATVEKLKELNPYMIIGAPPCQDFSSAGKRIEKDKASLTEDYANIVTKYRPIAFVMENVDRARLSLSYSKAREIFKNNGYGLTEVVLDASFYGSPQKRKRFIVFGVLGKDDGFADELFVNGKSEKPMTLRDYFGDSLGFEYYYRHPRNYSRRAIFSIDEPAPTMRGVNRPVPLGYKGHPLDSCPVSPDLHALTTKERALIQTFPPSFNWVGSKTDIEQMIGNAVPVNLGKFVAEVVKDVLEG